MHRTLIHTDYPLNSAGTFRSDQASPEISKLVDDCLNDEPELRPTARQVLDHLLKNKPAHLK